MLFVAKKEKEFADELRHEDEKRRVCVVVFVVVFVGGRVLERFVSPGSRLQVFVVRRSQNRRLLQRGLLERAHDPKSGHPIAHLGRKPAQNPPRRRLQVGRIAQLAAAVLEKGLVDLHRLQRVQGLEDHAADRLVPQQPHPPPPKDLRRQ